MGITKASIGRVSMLLVTTILMVLLSFGLSCSGADPVIYQTHVKVQAIWNYPAMFRERLLVQILADDDDGFDELYEVYVIHDEEELYWTVTKEEWTVVNDTQAREWIVISNLFENGQYVPRGKYRIILMDYSGYRDETSVTVTQPIVKYNSEYFPKLSKKGVLEYLPSINNLNDNDAPLYLELSYLKLGRNASSSKENELRNFIALLGPDHSFFQIQKNKPLKFYLKDNSSANAYLHYITKTGLILSSGPYVLNFKK